MRQPHQTCETCQHCAVVTGYRARLECRVNPPVVHVVSDFPKSLWPEVDAEDWCGQWGPKA